MEGPSFFTTPRVPVGGGLVAVQVFVIGDVVVRFGTQNVAIADERAQAAGVGVVRGTHVGEG